MTFISCSRVRAAGILLSRPPKGLRTQPLKKGGREERNFGGIRNIRITVANLILTRSANQPTLWHIISAHHARGIMNNQFFWKKYCFQSLFCDFFRKWLGCNRLCVFEGLARWRGPLRVGDKKKAVMEKKERLEGPGFLSAFKGRVNGNRKMGSFPDAS